MDTKVCSQPDCGAPIRSDNTHGLCVKHREASYQAERYVANREAINAKRRASWPERREADLKRQAARHAAKIADRPVRSCSVDECVARLRANNKSGLCPTHSRQHYAATHEKTPSEIAARAAYLAEYRLANTERRAEYNKAYDLSHPDRGADKQHLRRARIAAVPSERVYRRVVWERDGGICHICSEAADPAKWHLDHVIPISKGGAHIYANVAVSHPVCNLKKSAKIEGEWTK